MTSLRTALIQATSEVQQLPYAWPGPPDAASARSSGRGTCAAKHALLREQLDRLELRSARLMVVGPLVPDVWPDLQHKARGLLEVHECLTVETDWAGPLLVDVTWHPAAVRAGLAGTLGWDAGQDMLCAVSMVASYAVNDQAFRGQEELLRNRLYTSDQRAIRDQLLAEMAARAALIPDAGPLPPSGL